jgi:micrococcal nuclease
MFDGIYYYKANVVRVLDGDTVELQTDLGFGITKTFIARLWGINAPEIRSRNLQQKQKGLASKARLEKWLLDNAPGNNVLIKSHDGKQLKKEKYGRWLVEIYSMESNLKTISLNDILIEEGHAVKFLNTK